MRRGRAAWLLPAWLVAGAALAGGPVPLPENVRGILAAKCGDCHTGDDAEAGVRLDAGAVDADEPARLDVWRRAVEVVEERRMPPPDAEPLAAADRDALVAFLDPVILARTPFGGTRPRRLSRGEYEATIRAVAHLPDFTLPAGFPPDTERHGFDNLAEGLVLSPAHLEAYAATARDVADEIYPQPRPPARPGRWEAGPQDMTLSFSAASVHGDAVRLVSRSVDAKRSCTWPRRIEIRDSGSYTIAVTASKFLAPEGHSFTDPMRLEVYARPVTADKAVTVKELRLLRTIDVAEETPETVTFEADLYEGDTILFRWANAEMTHEFDELADQMAAWFQEDPRFLAAWQAAVFPSGDLERPETERLRGRNGWDIVSRLRADPALDLSQAAVDTPTTRRLLEVCRSMKGTYEIADALAYFYHDHGPALELHRVVIEGPSRPAMSTRDRARAAARLAIEGPADPAASFADRGRAMLGRFLPRAFRRPVDDATVATYLAIATRHWDAGRSFDDGMHLLLRSVLTSPRFLYRDLEPGDAAGDCDAFALATRLSYFLTQAPPDERLAAVAATGRLTDPAVLLAEAARLMPTKASAPLVESFVGQWLDTRALAGLMPDPKFKLTTEEQKLARQETEWFFADILARNLPLTTFIDPDFTWSSVAFCERNYGFTPRYATGQPASLRAVHDVTRQDEAERRWFRRLEIERGGRYGGLLGQAAIFMATANGVDTQPVLRGTWVLENILGMPSPPPPKNVPALTPDTRAAKTPREQLAAHTREASCATCHARIDPVGFLLENYDPVGRWREKWPRCDVPIDAAGTLPDGTVVTGPAEFKAWLVANIDLFSTCLAEKLLTYATGRVPNYAERREIEGLVRANRESGGGFRDLVLDLVASRTFRAK